MAWSAIGGVGSNFTAQSGPAAFNRWAYGRSGVASGLVVTPGSGTRGLNVSAGGLWVPGAVADTDATMAAPAPAANNGANSRWDLVVARLAWSSAGVLTPSLVTIGGTPAAAPAYPPFTRNMTSSTPTYDEPLGYVKVDPGDTSFATADIVDARRLCMGNAVALVIPGSVNWTSTDVPLKVRRVRDRVYLTGWLTRTDTALAADGTIANFGGNPIIPDGYRPVDQVVVSVASGIGSANPRLHDLVVYPDGTIALYAVTGPFAVGQVGRVTGDWLTTD